MMPTCKLVLIVEDDSDGQACRILLQKLGLQASIDWLPANGIGEIRRRGDKLIALARARITRDGCVAVLIDRDGKDIAHDDPHATIQRLCQQADVPLLLAVEAFEAWLLADSGCISWLAIKQSSNTDSLLQPKVEIARAYYKKTQHSYTRRARRLIAEKADGSAVRYSPSLKKALEQIKKCV